MTMVRHEITLEKGSSQDKPFQGWDTFVCLVPGFSLRSNPGLKLANAFGVLDPKIEDSAKRG
jgi:hypothetical protein